MQLLLKSDNNSMSWG